MDNNATDDTTDAATLTINAPPGPTGNGPPASAIPMSPVDRDLLTRTIIAEGGGSPAAMGAVANAIRNRVTVGSDGNFADTPAGVVLQKGQFEVWKDGSAARINPNSAQYDAGGRIVDAVMGGLAPDNTNGATHFYSPAAQASRLSDGRTPVPTWATNPTASVGGNVYFAPNGRVSRGGASPTPAPSDGDLSDDDIAGMLSGQGSAKPNPSAGAAGPGTVSPPPAAPVQPLQPPGGPAGAGASPAMGAPPVSAAPRGSAAAPDGGDLSDDDIAGMLSGRAPGAGSSVAGSAVAASGGTPGALTIHGAGNAAQAPALTPAAGPFGSLNRAAFGAPPPVAPQPASYMPGAQPDRGRCFSAPGGGVGRRSRRCPQRRRGHRRRPIMRPARPRMASRRCSACRACRSSGSTCCRRLGKGVPILAAAVNPLAARLASAVTGRSLDDTTATGNALSGQFEADHPGLTMASRLAGGAASMGPLVEAAPWAFGLQKGGTLAGKMATSGATNALLADADAIGPRRGPDLGRLPRQRAALRPGLRRAGCGRVPGGGTKIAGNALGAVYDRAANLATTQTASGVKGYGSAAVDYVLNKIAADGGTDALGAKLSDLGSEGMIADAGPSLRSETASLATVPGEIKSTVERCRRGPPCWPDRPHPVRCRRRARAGAEPHAGAAGHPGHRGGRDRSAVRPRLSDRGTMDAGARRAGAAARDPERPDRGRDGGGEPRRAAPRVDARPRRQRRARIGPTRRL